MATGRWDPDDVTAAGVRHVLLSYERLDAGDVQGYTSQYDVNAVVRAPGRVPALGRGAVAQGAADRVARPGCPDLHVVHHVVAAPQRIMVVGRMVGRVGTEFADVFTVSDRGLLLSQTTFYFR
ncbi:MAG TPA: hypothetical protein VGG05_29045 [Pseudonocardiaceae bacterium]|jgi:hypothetical protein